jgi:large subunit ribosomal protein L6
MSRIGNNPIGIPSGVEVKSLDSEITVKGSKGELKHILPDGIELNIENNVVKVSRNSESKQYKSLHGLTRALISNMIVGVSEGYKKTLKIEGVGFRAELMKEKLHLSLGYSHPIVFLPPNGIEFKTPNQTTVEISGIDKQLVGEVSSKIRSMRKPEPYKGKGVRYDGEHIRRKAGKTAAK